LSSGIVGQLDVIEAVGTWIEARRRQVDQEVLLLTRLVNLYKVLGGGWEKDEAVALGSRSVEQERNSAF
jgi:outer membrane protein TolC